MHIWIEIIDVLYDRRPMLDMMDLIDEKMGHAVLVQCIHKFQRRMVRKPQMVERQVIDGIRQAEFLLHALPENRRFPRPLRALQANKAITPVDFLEKIALKVKTCPRNQSVGNFLQHHNVFIHLFSP